MGFYKYTSISTATLILQNEKLRWSSPILFNDLEECQFTPFTKEQYLNSIEEYIKILTDCAKEQSNYNFNNFSDVSQLTIQIIKIALLEGSFDTNGIRDVIMSIFSSPETDYRNFTNKALIKCFRILCVTEAYDNNLMWAHYADQHYGCVIEFESLYINKPHLLREGYVRYHENLQPHSNPLDMLLYGETKEVRDLIIRDVVFSKRTNWNYEMEYRLLFAESFGEITTKINMQTNNKEIEVKNQPTELYTDVSISKEAIKSLIFGVRTTDKDIKKVLDVLTQNDYQCKQYQMVMKDGQMIKEELR